MYILYTLIGGGGGGQMSNTFLESGGKCPPLLIWAQMSSYTIFHRGQMSEGAVKFVSIFCIPAYFNTPNYDSVPTESVSVFTKVRFGPFRSVSASSGIHKIPFRSVPVRLGTQRVRFGTQRVRFGIHESPFRSVSVNRDTEI